MKRSVGAIMMMISLMLVVLAPSGHVVVGQEEDEVVNGLTLRPVRSNVRYHIQSEGRGLKVEENGCPESMGTELRFPTAVGVMFVTTSHVITLSTTFNIMTRAFNLPCRGSQLWRAVLDKPVFLNGTESSPESTFSFVKSKTPGFPTYNFVSGSGDSQGFIHRSDSGSLELRRESEYPPMDFVIVE